MFEGVTIASSIKNPLRDTITDDESGVSMEVVNISKEMFLPADDLQTDEYGFFINFTNDPLAKYSGVYFILGAVSDRFHINMQDILTLAHFYCDLRKLPQPRGIVPVTNIG